VFGRLGELQVADLLVVRTSAGDFTYRFREFRVVPRTDRTVIVPTPTAVLNLTTCYPFDSPVATTDAFIVSADLIDSKLNDQAVAD
jgi:sortase A